MFTKWSLYKELHASSGHDTKKGRTESTQCDDDTKDNRKKPETNQEQKSGQKKRE
jgi:hypothetical protein